MSIHESYQSRMNTTPELPVPISYIAGNYFVFSVDAATFLRREHNICGVLTGTLPQVPQQNVFTGLPLELMPEEARLLVEKGVACIVDEVNFQKQGMRSLVEEDRKKYLQELESQGLETMQLQMRRKERQRDASLKKIEEKKAAAKAKKAEAKEDTTADAPTVAEDSVVSLFADSGEPSSHISSRRPSTLGSIEPMGITPPVSHPPLPQQPPAKHLLPLPEVQSSYPLFAHLHSKGYFLCPGLRFGCQYLAYPGDPLRFHSHFLVVSTEWDEQLDLMTVISGGRLGTGVKKGFLIGGANKNVEESDGAGSNVRTFSIEWAGM